jgi:hypothetical protein
LLNIFTTWKADRIQSARRRLNACWSSIPNLGIEYVEQIYRNIQRSLAGLESGATVLDVFKVTRHVHALEKVIYHEKKLKEIDSRR